MLAPRRILLLGATLLPLSLTAGQGWLDAGRYPGAYAYPDYNAHATPVTPLHHLADYVPQGIAYWAARDRLLVSYYQEQSGREDSLIDVIDRPSGVLVKTVRVRFGHLGALAIAGNQLWIGDTSKVRRYALARIDAAPDGAYLDWDGVWRTRTATFLVADDGGIWVGVTTKSWDEPGPMFRYPIRADGSLSAQPVASRSAPGRTQGAVFTGRHEIFTRSYGRGGPSRISVHDTATGRWAPDLAAPSMIEDATVVNGRLAVAYESGASRYRDGEDFHGWSLNPVDTVDSLPLDWLTGRV